MDTVSELKGRSCKATERDKVELQNWSMKDITEKIEIHLLDFYRSAIKKLYLHWWWLHVLELIKSSGCGFRKDKLCKRRNPYLDTLCEVVTHQKQNRRKAAGDRRKLTGSQHCHKGVALNVKLSAVLHGSKQQVKSTYSSNLPLRLSSPSLPIFQGAQWDLSHSIIIIMFYSVITIYAQTKLLF